MESIGQSLDHWRTAHVRPTKDARQALEALALSWHTLTPGWAHAPLPEWAVESPWRLALLVQSGLGQGLDPEASQEHLYRLRRVALDVNAPLAVHDALTAAGAPQVTLGHASKHGARALQSCHAHALEALYRSHRSLIDDTIAGDTPVGLIIAVFKHLNSPDKRSRHILDLLAQWGARWDAPLLAKNLASASARQRVEWEPLIRQLQAQSLQARLPEGASTGRMRL